MDRQWDTYEEMATRGPGAFPPDARKATRAPVTPGGLVAPGAAAKEDH